MTWLPLDCHAHSVMSDGDLTVEDIVHVARQRGVRPSVADHVSTDIAAAIGSVGSAIRYLDVLDRFEVLRGGEFCWHDVLWREFPEPVVRRFTHRIGSLHAIWLEPPDRCLVRVFSARLPDGLGPDSYRDAHVANLEAFARGMPVDILAHPTLLPMPLRSLPPEKLWTEEREELAVETLARVAIAFEVSGRYPPHERIVRRAAARGVRLALGSDGHRAEQVGDVSSPLALTRSLGVPDADLYDSVVHGSRTGAFALTRDA